MYRFQKLVYSRQNFWTPYNYRWSGEQALDYDDRGEQNMKKNRTMKVIFNVGALAVLAALGISAYQLGTSQNGEIIQENLPMESVQKSDAKEDEIKEEASAQADTRLVQAETGSGSITAGENLIQEETQTEAIKTASSMETVKPAKLRHIEHFVTCLFPIHQFWYFFSTSQTNFIPRFRHKHSPFPARIS